MIKVVIFDLDDTLASEKEFIKSGFNHVSKIIAKKEGIGNRECYHELLNLFEKSPDRVFNRYLEMKGFEYTSEFIMQLIKEYRAHTPSIKFYKDVLKCFSELNRLGIKTGIITDGYKVTQNNKIDVLKLRRKVNKIIITDELGIDFWKPNSSSYTMMKEYFGVEYNEMVYVGDNINKDFIAPNELGMISIRIVRDDQIYAKDNELIKQSYHTIKSLDEIKGIIELY